MLNDKIKFKFTFQNRKMILLDPNNIPLDIISIGNTYTKFENIAKQQQEINSIVYSFTLQYAIGICQKCEAANESFCVDGVHSMRMCQCLSF